MCDKAVDTDPSTMKFIVECLITKELCDKVVNIFFCSWFYSLSVETQEIYDRVISEDPFLIVYCPDKYKIQRICDKAVDDSPATFRLISDWFVTSKMI